jgi:uncharacterized protein YkwD
VSDQAVEGWFRLMRKAYCRTLALFAFALLTACGGGGGGNDDSGSGVGTNSNVGTQSTGTPSFVNQPAPVSISVGQVATFNVSVAGTAPLSYQWRKNGSPIAGANAASYSVTTTLGDNGSVYSVVVTNAAGSATSANATLTVSSLPVAPSISGQPTAVSVVAGQAASFNVSATGDAPLTYQWQVSIDAGATFANIAGATQSSYTTSAVLADSGKRFRVVVVNGIGSVTSSSATLTVSSNPVVSDALYDRLPIVPSCDPGQLKAGEKSQVLNKINEIRALHRLPPVIYDAPGDIQTAKSSLITVANIKLTHTPTAADSCYSEDGRLGSGSSNIFIQYSTGPYTFASDRSVVSFLIDDGVASLGHRRWLLHPFLSRTSFGRVDGAPLVASTFRYVTGIAVKVIGYPDADLSGSSASYVAYPEGDYPSAYFKHGWFMSFSVLADKTSTFSNGPSVVDFSGATIEVKNPSGVALSISEQSADYTGFGIPNALQWKAAGTVSNVQYTVRILGVRVGGVVRNFSYVFRVQ